MLQPSPLPSGAVEAASELRQRQPIPVVRDADVDIDLDPPDSRLFRAAEFYARALSGERSDSGAPAPPVAIAALSLKNAAMAYAASFVPCDEEAPKVVIDVESLGASAIQYQRNATHEALHGLPDVQGENAGLINGLLHAVRAMLLGDGGDEINLAHKLIKPHVSDTRREAADAERLADPRIAFSLSVVRRLISNNDKSLLEVFFDDVSTGCLDSWQADSLLALLTVFFVGLPSDDIDSLAIVAARINKSHTDDTAAAAIECAKEDAMRDAQQEAT